MEPQMKDVVALFKQAYEVLTRAKCRVTAMAYFNRAQEMLDELEKHPDPEIVKAIKEVRKACRATIGKDKSLHRKLEVYAAYWQQAQ